MKERTRIAQLGTRWDEKTGAVSPPIHHAATYQHPAFGQSTGYDYTRTANPTRTILEDAIAALEGGVRGFAFSSGMAAVTTVLAMFSGGDHILASDDLYGGTYRLLERVYRPFGLDCSYVNMEDAQDVKAAITPKTRAIFVETPTNPTMQITDIRKIAALCEAHGLLLIVDNTFMTPCGQKPHALGADIVLHSGTKYINGHNDVLCGLVTVKSPELADRVGFLQNSIGAVLGPQDCWLTIRGLKTLSLRFERQQENAQVLARWLTEHKTVTRVYYPGLREHPGFETHRDQAVGPGAMISFTVDSPERAKSLLGRVRLVMFAESLGGLETMVTYPAVQTHADLPLEIRERLGITDTLLRMSVGIEDVEDLMEDIDQGLRTEGTTR